MRIAVMGGGLTGVCTALELAERGGNVDLFEQADELLTQASLWNEGKIHLGFVYVNDPSFRTARRMMRGALTFRPLLERWIPSAVLDDSVSDPFDYAVPRDTAVSPPLLERHFERVVQLYFEELGDTGKNYIAPRDGAAYRALSRAERAEKYDDELVIAAYTTPERSIDPQRIAESLRSAAADCPRLNVHIGTAIRRLTLTDAKGVRIDMETGGQRHTESYATAVNALWQNRLGIDATAGLDPPHPVIHRYKVGLHARGIELPTLPTTTFVSGPYGDTVRLRERAYLSWYPAGLVYTDRSITPRQRSPEIEKQDIIDQTISAISRLMPGPCERLSATRNAWTIGGGYITAWGRTDIQDPRSTLHERHRIGVTSVGALHSIDTGKYTMAPYFAHEACRRIVG